MLGMGVSIDGRVQGVGYKKFVGPLKFQNDCETLSLQNNEAILPSCEIIPVNWIAKVEDTKKIPSYRKSYFQWRVHWNCALESIFSEWSHWKSRRRRCRRSEMTSAGECLYARILYSKIKYSTKTILISNNNSDLRFQKCRLWNHK